MGKIYVPQLIIRRVCTTVGMRLPLTKSNFRDRIENRLVTGNVKYIPFIQGATVVYIGTHILVHA